MMLMLAYMVVAVSAPVYLNALVKTYSMFPSGHIIAPQRNAV